MAVGFTLCLCLRKLMIFSELQNSKMVVAHIILESRLHWFMPNPCGRWCINKSTGHKSHLIIYCINTRKIQRHAWLVSCSLRYLPSQKCVSTWILKICIKNLWLIVYNSVKCSLSYTVHMREKPQNTHTHWWLTSLSLTNWAPQQLGPEFTNLPGFLWVSSGHICTVQHTSGGKWISPLKNSKLIASILINAPICRWWLMFLHQKLEQLTSIYTTQLLASLQLRIWTTRPGEDVLLHQRLWSLHRRWALRCSYWKVETLVKNVKGKRRID